MTESLDLVLTRHHHYHHLFLSEKTQSTFLTVNQRYVWLRVVILF